MDTKAFFHAVVLLVIGLVGYFGLVRPYLEQSPIIWGAIFIWGLLFFVNVFQIFKDVKDTLYISDEDSMSYSRDGFKLHVDKARKLVVVDGCEISPFDFSYVERNITKEVTYNTGGNQTVYGNTGGSIGSVYVPGESGSYQEDIGKRIQIQKQHQNVSTVEFSSQQIDSHSALLRVLIQVKAWCESQAKDTASDALEVLCASAGMGVDSFNKARWSKDGVLLEAIVVDRTGKAAAVYKEGGETWIGTLNGASASIIDGKLEVKVDDPEYRSKHLTERRFAVFDKEPREVLVEWEDRINLLAKGAA